MDMSRFQNIGTNITASFSPFAARTGQFVREQFGQAEDKVDFPIYAVSAAASSSTELPLELSLRFRFADGVEVPRTWLQQLTETDSTPGGLP